MPHLQNPTRHWTHSESFHCHHLPWKATIHWAYKIDENKSTLASILFWQRTRRNLDAEDMKNTYNTYAITPTLLQKENNIVKVVLLSQASHTRDVIMHQSITNWKASVVYCYLLFISNFLWLSAFWPYVPHVAGQTDRLVADDFRSWGRQNWHFVNSLKIFRLNMQDEERASFGVTWAILSPGHAYRKYP